MVCALPQDLPTDRTPLTSTQPAFELPASPLDTTPSRTHLEIRQAVTTTVAANQQPTGGCPGQYSGGVLAGAIVGSIFGTLLLVFLWSALTNARGIGPTVVEREVKVKKRRHGSRSRSGSYSSGPRRPSRVYSTRS